MGDREASEELQDGTLCETRPASGRKQEAFLEESLRQAPTAGQGSFSKSTAQLVMVKQGGLTGETPLTDLARVRKRPLGREQLPWTRRPGWTETGELNSSIKP